MTSTLKVKNGRIALPAEIRRAWRNAVIRVTATPKKITLVGPGGGRPVVKLAQWKAGYGIIKDAKNVNASAWQRTIRKAWKRTL